MYIYQKKRISKIRNFFIVLFCLLFVLTYQIFIPLSLTIAQDELAENETTAIEKPAPPADKQESDQKEESSEETQPTTEETKTGAKEETKQVEEKDIQAQQVKTDQTTANSPTEESASEQNNSEQTTENSPEDNVQSNIQTQDSNASTILYNEANTNAIGENYTKETENITGEKVGDINLLENFQQLSQQADENETENTEITNDNTAEITNQTYTDSNTGNNEIETDSSFEENSIETKNASAETDIVNVANTNLVGENWIFSMINIFGDWTGDLILPGEDLVTAQKDNTQFDVTNENQATVENNTTTNANTGANEISNSTDASISTGQSNVSSQTANTANTNIAKNNWFMLLINNMGSWSGEVIGWDGEKDSNVYSYDFPIDENLPQTGEDSTVKVTNKNEATVINNTVTNANTGANKINGGGKAEIKTGDASAWTKIVNFLNTNIVGNNWIFAVVNVFGNWKGNVVFAYPDLSINISNNSPTLYAGDSFEYKVTVANEGKADAENVIVQTAASEETQFESNETKEIGKLKAGEKKSFTISAKVNENTPANTYIEAITAAKTSTAEKNTANNTSTARELILNTDKPIKEKEIDPELTIFRKQNSQSAKPGDLLSYEIEVKNTGGSNLYETKVSDKIFDPTKKIVQNLNWTVGNLKKGEKAIIQYTLKVNEGIQPGTYTSAAQAQALSETGKEIKTSEKTTTLIEAPYLENYSNNPLEKTTEKTESENSSPIEAQDQSDEQQTENSNQKAKAWTLLTLTAATVAAGSTAMKFRQQKKKLKLTKF